MKIIIAICLSFFLLVFPVYSEDPDTFPEIGFSDQDQISKGVEILEIETPHTISDEDLEDLLGPDPYLGQTDWLSGKKQNKA